MQCSLSRRSRLYFFKIFRFKNNIFYQHLKESRATPQNICTPKGWLNIRLARYYATCWRRRPSVGRAIGAAGIKVITCHDWLFDWLASLLCDWLTPPTVIVPFTYYSVTTLLPSLPWLRNVITDIIWYRTRSHPSNDKVMWPTSIMTSFRNLITGHRLGNPVVPVVYS